MISICITVKNRSRVRVEDRELLLFPNCVDSIVKATKGLHDVELVVSDWHSDDWPLDEWLTAKTAQAISTRIVSVDGHFCRGRGRNVAAEHASGKILFFLDADCLISSGVLASGQHVLQDRKSYFPILYSFADPGHRNGWWRNEGFGNCIVSKQIFQSTEGWPEYVAWGKEDDHFYARVASQSEIVRERVNGFFHQWHPEEIAWKDRYLDDPETNRVRDALDVIWKYVALGETLILVDGGQFGGHEHGAGRTVLPMTEKEGVYWGPPADGTHAVQELKRLILQGAKHIAFAWMTFWWLDHYAELREFLESNGHCRLESESLIIFDLPSAASPKSSGAT